MAARSLWPCSASQSPNDRASAAGSSGSTRLSASIASWTTARSVPERQQPIPSQRSGEVQRGRKPGATQARPSGMLVPPTRGQNRDVEPGLQGHAAAGFEPLEQLPVRRAAAQEDVLPVVGRDAIAHERVGRATQASPAFEQRHGRPAARALEAGRDPGQAAADDHHPGPAQWSVSIVVPDHEPSTWRPDMLRAATHAFSQTGSDTRRSRTAVGSSEIRSRIDR